MMIKKIIYTKVLYILAMKKIMKKKILLKIKIYWLGAELFILFYTCENGVNS